MALLGSTKKLIGKTKKMRKHTKSWNSWSSFVQYNLIDNQYQQKSEVLNTLTPSKSYAYLLNVEPCNLVLLKTYNTEFDEVIIIFTDQNEKPLKRQS